MTKAEERFKVGRCFFSGGEVVEGGVDRSVEVEPCGHRGEVEVGVVFGG